MSYHSNLELVDTFRGFQLIWLIFYTNSILRTYAIIKKFLNAPKKRKTKGPLDKVPSARIHFVTLWIWIVLVAAMYTELSMWYISDFMWISSFFKKLYYYFCYRNTSQTSMSVWYDPQCSLILTSSDMLIWLT